jgi:hypothetical protein
MDFLMHEQTHILTRLERTILMNLEELLTTNESIKNQLNKAETELVARLADLQASVDKLTAALASVELTPEQEQSVTELQAAAQALDDLTPDTPA